MNAIAALLRARHAPARREDVSAMLQAMRHRASAPVGVAADGSAAIGACSKRDVPAAPAGSAERANLLLVAADARLDDTANLAAALGLPPHASSESLILAAYERWDTGAPERLTGDFAFVIWDGRRRRLFCARDHFGVKPLYYARTDDLVAIASEMKALLALPDLPRELDEARIADFLEGVVDDPAATFYRHIRRLPPAHLLLANDNTLTLRRYWCLDVNVPDAAHDASTCIDRFRDTFTEAVRRRLPNHGPVGTMLSGGLDSASITCTARQVIARGEASGPLHTFTALFPGVPESDERRYVEGVLAGGGVLSHLVDATALPPMATIDAMLDAEDEPKLAANLFIDWALYATARDAGIDVLLEGIDGDTVVSHGIYRLVELARARQWRGFVAESAGVATLRRRDPMLNLKHYAFPAITARAREGHWLAALADAVTLGRAARVPAGTIVRQSLVSPLLAEPLRGRLRRKPSAVAPKRRLVRGELASRTALDERRAAVRLPRAATERADHHARLTRGIFGYGFEVIDHAAAAFGIEARYPFFDKQLVELSLSIPAEFKLRDGWTRWILRQAMGGILPTEIQWRPGKADVGVHFRRSLLAWHRQEIESLVHDSPPELQPFVDECALRHQYEEYAVRGADHAALALWQALVVARWLRRTRPPKGMEYACETARESAAASPAAGVSTPRS